MAILESQDLKSSSKPSEKLHLGLQIGVRSIAVATTLAAAWSMFTSDQITEIFGIPFKARYSYSPAFKFFAVANIVVCCFTALSLVAFAVSVFAGSGSGFSSGNYFGLFVHDLVVMSLELSAAAAATAIGYLGMNGNSKAGWLPICDHVPGFCSSITRSLVLAYVSLLLLLLLTLLSAINSRHQSLSI